MVHDPWFETAAENSEVPPEAWDVMMTNHRQKVNCEDETEEEKQHTLSDDRLSKDELLERRVDEDKKRESMQASKPPPKDRIEREQPMITTSPNAPATESAPESDFVPKAESDEMDLERERVCDVGLDTPIAESKSTEGPIASSRLNPRQMTQRKVMNIGHANVNSHFESVERTRELQVEKQWTRGMH